MANRTSSTQSAHDTAVKRIADEYNSNNWTVKADDLSEYDDPDTLGSGGTTQGRIPDIIATKRGSRRIIEIETSRDDDEVQHRVFKNHTRAKANTRLIIWLVKSNGDRQEKLYDSAT